VDKKARWRFFWCWRAIQNFVRILARVPKILFGSGWLRQPIQKIKAYFWLRLVTSADMKNSIFVSVD
jgi:hypothetical protein